jgi:hypothetical protein
VYFWGAFGKYLHLLSGRWQSVNADGACITALYMFTEAVEAFLTAFYYWYEFIPQQSG